MSLVGADHFLLRFCPRRERLQVCLLEGVALSNCVAVGYSLAAPLVRLGESPPIAIIAGFFAGSWFACIQLFMVIAHVQERSRVRGLLSRLCCLALLSLFGLLVSAGITFGFDAASSGWWCDRLTLVLLPSFLLPWLAAPKILCRGVYYNGQQEAEAQCLNQWRRFFIPRYEELIRKKYRDGTYRIPPAMTP